MKKLEPEDLGEEFPAHFQKNKIAFVELKKKFYIRKDGQLKLKNKEKEYASKHYEENKEYYSNKKKQWIKNNFERQREIQRKYNKKYKEKNKEKIKERKREYYLKNREIILEKTKNLYYRQKREQENVH